MADLELQHISKSFGHTRVLNNVSLEADTGEFVVLLGPSGCGKSTLLRIIAGLEPQTEGSVLIGSTPVDALSPRDRDIAMVFQHYALYPHLTVRENLAFGLKLRKEPANLINSRIQEAADLLEIQPLLGRRPKELSGGQRQRVAMGRALVRKPKLFLFDEPLSNLDARLRTSTRVELKKLHQRLGVTMIYVTHDQVEAMTLGDRIVILDQGEVQQVGTPEQIYQRPQNPFVAGFIGNPPMNLLEGHLEQRATGLHFCQKDLDLLLPSLSIPSQAGSSRNVVLGIRPEAIQVNHSQKSGIILKGTVDLLEHLGADTVMYVHVQSQQLLAKVPPHVSFNLGDTVSIAFPPEHLHLFIDNQRVEFS